MVVPKKRVQEILKEIHDSSSREHFKVNKTLEKIHKRFYWASCELVKTWIGAERAKSVLFEGARREKENLRFKFIMLELHLREFKWTYLVHFR